jgi:hypothetical protein
MNIFYWFKQNSSRNNYVDDKIVCIYDLDSLYWKSMQLSRYPIPPTKKYSKFESQQFSYNYVNDIQAAQ